MKTIYSLFFALAALPFAANQSFAANCSLEQAQGTVNNYLKKQYGSAGVLYVSPLVVAKNYGDGNFSYSAQVAVMTNGGAELTSIGTVYVETFSPESCGNPVLSTDAKILQRLE